jgi:hypothetical protein
MRLLLVPVVALAVALPCAATSPCPPPKPQQVFVTFLGSMTGCTTFGGIQCVMGEIITFEVNAFAYTFCAGQTFTWNFGDGTTATGRTVTHAYAQPGVHEVELAIVTGGENVLRIRQRLELPHGDPPPRNPPRRRAVRH